LWVCRAPNGSESQAFLVDKFEAVEQWAWTLKSYPSSMDPLQLAKQIMNEADQDLPGFAGDWDHSLRIVLANLQPVNQELVLIEDSLHEILPNFRTCSGGSWTYVQFANFTEFGQVLYSNIYWNSPLLNNLDKAGLIVHETIYRWLRSSYQDQNSKRARYITGVLLSTLPATEKASRINRILQEPLPSPHDDWFCSSHNQHNDQIYGSYGATEFETRNSVLMTCQSGPDPFFCEDYNTQCEKITTPQIAWACTVSNRGTLYMGRGRAQLESLFRAELSCSQNNDRFFCFSQPPNCQPL
jgi:hypothetical protein